MGNNNKDLFTPGELIERYPALKKLIGRPKHWGSS
jgi:hypothetical protein